MSRPKKPAECHPDRPHYAMGMCRRCYQSTSYIEARPVRDRRIKAEDLGKANFTLFKAFLVDGQLLTDIAAEGCKCCGIKDQNTWWLMKRPEGVMLVCEGCHWTFLRLEGMDRGVVRFWLNT